MCVCVYCNVLHICLRERLGVRVSYVLVVCGHFLQRLGGTGAARGVSVRDAAAAAALRRARTGALTVGSGQRLGGGPSAKTMTPEVRISVLVCARSGWGVCARACCVWCGACVFLLCMCAHVCFLVFLCAVCRSCVRCGPQQLIGGGRTLFAAV